MTGQLQYVNFTEENLNKIRVCKLLNMNNRSLNSLETSHSIQKGSPIQAAIKMNDEAIEQVTVLEESLIKLKGKLSFSNYAMFPLKQF